MQGFNPQYIRRPLTQRTVAEDRSMETLSHGVVHVDHAQIVPPVHSMGLEFGVGPAELARLSGIWDSTHSPANIQSLINGVAGWLVFGLVGDACAKKFTGYPTSFYKRAGGILTPQSSKTGHICQGGRFPSQKYSLIAESVKTASARDNRLAQVWRPLLP
ncbi:hypothetical protein B0H19DRAFT_1232554 [Mycena capillaripes]|nr:hypothetical protein B0H19DRAFT_1232554 [Mycena capillaripes]